MKNPMNFSTASLIAITGLALSTIASADLVASVDTLAYGTIAQNSQSTMTVIKNTSTTQTVTDITTEINGNNSNFFLSVGCPGILFPQQECYLDVTFAAS
jgi:hypothetical protein